MSDHHFNRHSCNCQSSGHSHHTQCGCRMKHDDHHQDFSSCSCNSFRHRRSFRHDTCRCQQVDRFSRNHFRRNDDRFDSNRRNRGFTSQAFSRLTPLRHHRHGDDCFSHNHDRNLHGRNHSINETIRMNKDDDGKKNIVIIM